MIALAIVFILCLIVALIMSAARNKKTEEPVFLDSKPVKKKAPKVRSYDRQQKRMSKKKYLSEHSEYVYIPTPEAQDIVGIQDQELIDSILDAILNGDKVVKVKRETYNKIKDGKILQNGDQPLQRGYQ